MGSASPAPAGTDPFVDALSPQPYAFVRQRRTRTATAGYAVSEEAVSGSPFLGMLLYRTTQVDRRETDPGVASLDRSAYLQISDANADIRVNDIALLHDGTRAKVLRARIVEGKLQCDLELGAV